MSNSFSFLNLDVIAAAAVDYLFTKSAMLSRVYIETIAQENIPAGIKQIQVPLPAAAQTPTDMGNDANGMANPNNITIPNATIDPFQFRKKVLFNLSDLESRKAQGNAAEILANVMPGTMDGLANFFDQQLTALYTNYALQTTKSSTAFLDKTYITEACNLLENHNVPLERCYAVITPNNWWQGLFADGGIIQAQQYGSAQPIQGGKIPGLFGLAELDRSNNITKTTLSGATTAHNVVFDKYAFAAAFVKFEPANKYGDPNVQESILVYRGLPVRVHKWFDAATASWYARLDVAGGVGVLDTNRFVHVPSKES